MVTQKIDNSFEELREKSWVENYLGNERIVKWKDVLKASSLLQKEHEKEINWWKNEEKLWEKEEDKLKKEVDELKDELVMTKGIKDNYGQNMNAWRKKSMGQHHYINNLKQQLKKCKAQLKEASVCKACFKKVNNKWVRR